MVSYAFRCIVAASLVFCSACAPPAPPPIQEPALPDLQARTVRVGVNGYDPPFSSRAADQGLVGWDIDLFTELGLRLNFNPEFVELELDDLLPAVKAGTIDAIAGGISITLDRLESVDFTAAFLINNQRAVVRTTEERFATLVEAKTLAALRVGVVADSTNEAAARDYFGEERVATYSSYVDLAAALAADEIDVAIVDDPVAEALAADGAAVRELPGSIRSDLLGIALPKGSDLTEPIGLAFDAMIADGTARDLNDKWGLR